MKPVRHTQQPVAPSPKTTVRRIEVNLDEDEDVPGLTFFEPFVRMVGSEMEAEKKFPKDQTYVMTYSDSDEDWCVCGAVKSGGDTFFQSAVDLTNNNPNGITYNIGGSSPDECCVRGVGVEEKVKMVLDSGTDISCLPMSYSKVDGPMNGKSILRDAQYQVMRGGGGLRQAIVKMVDD